jgi:hypothetical protein
MKFRPWHDRVVIHEKKLTSLQPMLPIGLCDEPPEQAFATRALLRHGATGEARRHRRSGRPEVLSRGARSRSRRILRDRRREHLSGLAAIRAIFADD